MTEDGRQRGERLQIMLSDEELTALDDFRFATRMPTRAAAIRELLKLGMAAVRRNATPGMKSSDYGVLSRGEEAPAGKSAVKKDAGDKS